MLDVDEVMSKIEYICRKRNINFSDKMALLEAIWHLHTKERGN